MASCEIEVDEFAFQHLHIAALARDRFMILDPIGTEIRNGPIEKRRQQGDLVVAAPVLIGLFGDDPDDILAQDLAAAGKDARDR